ncbi:PREDICTED: CD99 antigen-like [Condylura cristata]|uniref:CD99 antigen-like n=1 Tax=Condylura cristata TaxID=143302 RepID=UPI0006431AE5|nr:PREDICTED: CD99 antigen-like [Condylura cristata]
MTVDTTAVRRRGSFADTEPANVKSGSLIFGEDVGPRSPCRRERGHAPSWDDFNLEDALGGGGSWGPGAPPGLQWFASPPPRTEGPCGVTLSAPPLGGFSDSDLFDGTADGGGGGHGGRAGPEGHDNTQNGGAPQADSPGVLSGIIGSVVVAVVGAVSSFIAYQKKKLCFKQSADQSEMNMENHSSKAEPPVQQTLLEK